MKSPLKRVLTLLFAAALINTVGCAHAAKLSVHEHTLDNGLKLVVKEDHRAPVIVSQLWYDVGSGHEVNGNTGIAHILEHMMFKGTETVPNGEFSRRIAKAGGRENAFTSRDYTVYHQQLEKTKLPMAIELEADRMHNLVLSAEELEKELQVILEERRWRTDDKPISLTYERFNAIAYMSSPYHHPVIGWPEDIKQTTIDDLSDWYKRWYIPNNAVLVIAGDVDPMQVKALVNNHYGKIPRGEEPTIKSQPEVAQLGTREIEVNIPAELEYLIMGYKAPSLVTAEDKSETYALMMLASVLDGGSSARFTNELVREKQIAVSAFASYSPYSRLSTHINFGGIPASGQTLESLQAAIEAQIANVIENGVTDKELDRVQAQVLASTVYQQDSLYYQAMEIGMLETLGLGWELGEQFSNEIAKVTSAQIQAVAKKYLKPKTLTIARLVPQTAEENSNAK